MRFSARYSNPAGNIPISVTNCNSSTVCLFPTLGSFAVVMRNFPISTPLADLQDFHGILSMEILTAWPLNPICVSP